MFLGSGRMSGLGASGVQSPGGSGSPVRTPTRQHKPQKYRFSGPRALRLAKRQLPTPSSTHTPSLAQPGTNPSQLFCLKLKDLILHPKP